MEEDGERAFDEEGQKPSHCHSSREEEGFLILMRHSHRLDDKYAEDFSAIPDELWPDRWTRPYDPPICDWDLPKTVSDEIRKFNVSKVVSSPFLRCLQTAGVIVRQLELGEIYVDNRLGEYLLMVERCWHRSGLLKTVEGLSDSGLPKFEYLSLQQAQVAVKGDSRQGVQVRWDRDANQPAHPDHIVARTQMAISDIMHDAPVNQNVLIVTHGDLFNAYLPELFEGVGKYRADLCGWAFLRRPQKERCVEDDVIETARVQEL